MKKKIIFLMVLLLPMFSNLFAQKSGKKYFITGQVVDDNNKPIADALVLVDFQNTGVVTDSRGMYKVKVKASAAKISVFKLANGQSEEEINGRTVINFRLGILGTAQVGEKDSPEDETVNAGYGTASKKDLTTSIRKIDGQNNNAAYQSIYEMLRVDPSVQVNGKKITIRGVNSVNSTDPLLVVDGIVVSTIEDISPSMVKSIEILKGSDAAIYGARGANGVIMITLVSASTK